MKQSSSWSESSSWYNKIVGTDGHYYHQHVVLPAALKLLELQAGAKLLDVGCGQGVLSRSIPKTVEYWGVDISQKLIKTAISLSTNPLHHFKVEDVTKQLFLPHVHFSHAAILLALQNFNMIEPVFDHLSDLLSPGGKLVMIVNHPCFRIPRQSGWDVDEKQKLQKRWVSRYMSKMDIPITMHPGQSGNEMTWSYHYPLSDIVSSLKKASFVIDTMDELVSTKESVGNQSKMENRGRSEIPLFLAIRALKK